MSAARKLEALLEGMGVVLNGPNPWDPHISVPSEQFARRILRGGSLALGESYMDGWWECDDLTGLIVRLIEAKIDARVRGNWRMLLSLIPYRVLNMQDKVRAWAVARQHYDVGNDLYRRMLDGGLWGMNYSCAYWRGGARSLEEAQTAKLERICRKLHLRPGMRVLDIGCGWGAFARYAAEHYDVEVVGVTLSKAQLTLCREKHGSDARLAFHLCDYRDIAEEVTREPFDRVVSIGMFEHVGYKNYSTFFAECAKLLIDDGLMLLHAIGGHASVTRAEPWINKYIFPHGMLPSIAQIGDAFAPHLLIQDVDNFGLDYARTLQCWRANIEASWDEIPEYDERFRRMWNYYLQSSEAMFRAGRTHLWQFVFSKEAMSYQRVA